MCRLFLTHGFSVTLIYGPMLHVLKPVKLLVIGVALIINMFVKLDESSQVNSLLPPTGQKNNCLWSDCTCFLSLYLCSCFTLMALLLSGYREGFLWKRGRDNGQFLSRKFILSERECVLKYFNKHDAREPKAIMKINTVNATFQPTKIGVAHGLQITYLKDNSTRNIFVYHEDGKEIVDWFNAIRAARFHYLQVAFPGAAQSELLPKLTRNYIKEGYMEKTGPKHTEGFKRRWFTMDDRRLMYFKDPQDAYARGEVFIGCKDNKYTVLSGLPANTQGYHWQFGITIVTPDRKFLFACETEEDQKDWIAAFQSVINRPMLPQEYAVEAYFKHKP
ncbi:arf-GAP with dual PH domain-containing protein 1-like isoform X2 [Xyrichtys novacula]|uniref:Arf-GAP with dual PH domain-containing protein 1-like isoform X2 n=1 Tax=Xyrichtys novacula TaxID=13765 RepID=A0AAV1GRP8_XYRNO|nr:arf-GAP with dual PH domain-containing protein 1-like isoform X2 [Xyrichtys novacula]